MKKCLIRSIKIWILSIGCLTLCFSSFAQRNVEKGDYFLQIDNSKLSFGVESKIELKVVLTNVKESEIYFIRGIDRDDFYVELKEVEGREVSYSKDAEMRNRLPKTGSRYLVSLKPGEEYKFALDLADFYKLQQGKYFITISRTVLGKDIETSFKVQTKPIEITISNPIQIQESL